MIDHLAGRPDDEAAKSWLKEVSRDTVLNPRISEEWILLDQRKALRAANGTPDSTSSENIYLLYGHKTFAIRITRNAASSATCQRILSTFKFAPAK